MKKLLTTLGILTVLGLGIAFGAMVAQDVKDSIQEYVKKDLVSEPYNIEEINQHPASAQKVKEKTYDKNVSLNATSIKSSEFEQSIEDSEDSTVEAEEIADVSESEDQEEVSDKEAEEAIETALNIKNPSISIDAESAILLDGTGKVMFYKNPTDTVYPASTTKLMTALVALDLCELDDEITIGSEVTYIAYDSSRAYLEEGQRLTLKMLLEGMLLPSGNDAAYAVAAYAGRISLGDQEVDSMTAIEEFVKLMNEKVIELGLTDTCFMNPDGYDEEGQYTTAYDMGIIAITALNNSTIREITGKTEARNTFLSGEDVTWYSTNKLIVYGSGRYYKYAIGLKTGSSSLAGRCLVSAAQKDDHTYVSVVMNSTASGRWEDSISLLSYGIEK